MIFVAFSHLKMSKIPKHSKFRAAEIVKMAVFQLLKAAKLISRKIKVEEKLLKFHTV